MPRQKKRPTKFVSDDESDGEVNVEHSPPAPSVEDLDDTPSAKQKPGHLRRVYTLEDDDNDTHVSVNHPPMRAVEPTSPPPMVLDQKVKTDKVDITELVAILANSNASLKGKIDDTGRFELEFMRNPGAVAEQPLYREVRDEPTRAASQVKSRREVRTKPGKRLIGW